MIILTWEVPSTIKKIKNKHMKKTLFLLMLTLSVFLQAASYTLENIPNPKVTDIRNYVSNPDGIISQTTVNELNIMLDTLENRTRSEVAIVVVESIGDENIEMFATSLFKLWGIGKEKEDNGMLVLFVQDQRKIRLEVGYGLEGVMPDAMAGRIRDEQMIPYFKSGNIDEGFLQGTKRIVSVLSNEKFEEKKEPVAWGEILPLVGAVYIIILLISVIWMSNAVSKVKKNAALVNNMARYKALKTEKSGILLIMNIIFPAIGLFLILMLSNPLFLVFLIGVPVFTYPAAVYGKIMMRKFRRAPFACNSCDGTMHILSERKEDAHLKVSQQFEEQLHAVDYDVFVCKDCGNEAIFTLDKPSMYSDCPKCNTKAFIYHNKHMLVAPTYVSAGTERTTYKCKFCGYEEHKNTTIPRYSRSGAVAGGAVAGSLFSGRGGFGGGGGGFSGGSFGGGMSGGGGASGSW
jgi:uncharacterized protein